MLDVSIDRKDPSKAVAYLDGRDARIFRALYEKLGSEDRVHNAIILMGLVAKLRTSNASSARLELQRVKTFFPEYVGLSCEKVEKLVQDI